MLTLILKYHIHLSRSSVFSVEPLHVHLTSSISKGFVDHYGFMEHVKVRGKVHPITGHEGPEVE
jgi:hypothetical protein